MGRSWNVSCTLSGMAFALVVGYLVDQSGTEGYNVAFAIASFGYLIGIGVIHLLIPKMKTVKEFKV